VPSSNRFHTGKPVSKDDSESKEVGLNKRADFILVYYMIHETPNPKEFLAELKGLLKDSGKLLIVEPRIHVSRKLFETMLMDAEDVVLGVKDLPRGKGGRSVLFMRK